MSFLVCVNCGCKTIGIFFQCAVFGNHPLGHRALLCSGCYCNDGGICYACELEQLNQASSEKPVKPLDDWSSAGEWSPDKDKDLPNE